MPMSSIRGQRAENPPRAKDTGVSSHGVRALDTYLSLAHRSYDFSSILLSGLSSTWVSAAIFKTGKPNGWTLVGWPHGGGHGDYIEPCKAWV